MTMPVPSASPSASVEVTSTIAGSTFDATFAAAADAVLDEPELEVLEDPPVPVADPNPPKLPPNDEPLPFVLLNAGTATDDEPLALVALVGLRRPTR
jgi:hypothetical protein